jgi:hypothetical protein
MQALSELQDVYCLVVFMLHSHSSPLLRTSHCAVHKELARAPSLHKVVLV